MLSKKLMVSAFAAGLTVSAVASAATPAFQFVNKRLLADGEAEILSFSTDGDTLASTSNGAVKLFDIDAAMNITDRATVDFSAAFGLPTDLDSVSSTALDTAQRGFGAAALIPTANGSTLGKVGFYNYTTGAVLHTVDVGFHPDSIKFSADGTQLFVANEGEATTGGNTDAPGSLSIIDLTAVTGVGNLVANLGAVHTFDFTAGNLAAGVSLAGTRINDTTVTAGNEFRHIEPEFITLAGDEVYVSLQENNAIGVFDLTSNKWSDIHNLGTISNTIDASDKDGIDISDTIPGLPMPDAIATYTKSGNTYIVTANEGDAHVNDIDAARVKNLGGIGVSVDPVTEATLNGIYGDYTTDNALGRLDVSLVDGNTDADAEIEVLTAFGTRSFSIWNAATGALVADSGSLESFLAGFDPLIHNANDGGDPTQFDKRSDNKGPEPEGLDVITLPNGTVLLAVGMERQNGLVLADITDPNNIQLLDYINSRGEVLYRPESLTFISADDSPNGFDTLLVGYEGESGIGNGVGVYTVPEPAGFVMLGLGAMAMLRRRRA